MSVLTRNMVLSLSNKDQICILDTVSFNMGGNGKLYHVEWHGRTFILKWISGKDDATWLYKNVKELSLEKPIEDVTWPLAMTMVYSGCFGYVMEEVSSDYVPLEYLFNDTSITSHESYEICKKIVNLVCKIHENGYCIGDLNPKNILIDKKKLSVIICDCDYIHKQSESAPISGVMQYMAPELCTGISKPTVHSDNYSLAVILYMLIFGEHPLVGKRVLDESLDDVEVFGTNPLYVRNLFDLSNGSIFHDARGPISVDIFLAFLKTFTDGLKQPHIRTSDTSWRDILSMSHSLILRTTVRRFIPIFFMINSDNYEDISELEEIVDRICGCLNNNPSSYDFRINVIDTYKKTSWFYENPVSSKEKITISQKNVRNFREDAWFIYLNETLLGFFRDIVIRSPIFVFLDKSSVTDIEDMMSVLNVNRCYRHGYKIAIQGFKEPDMTSPIRFQNVCRNHIQAISMDSVRAVMYVLTNSFTVTLEDCIRD